MSAQEAAPSPPRRDTGDDMRDLLLAVHAADMQLVRYIDRRRRLMPADLAAFATVLRDSRIQTMREIERRYRLQPYERS